MTVRVPIRQDRSLFNPKFEGYKLSFLEESRQHFVAVGSSGMGISVPKIPNTTKLSYRELQHRIRHNHLHPGWNCLKKHSANGDNSATGGTIHRDGVLFAIGQDFILTALQYDKTAKRLRSKSLIQIPVPVITLNFHLELPSVKPISPDYLLVADGATSFYLVHLTFSGLEYEGKIVATTEFKPNTSLGAQQQHHEEEKEDDNDFVPCGLLDAKAFLVETNNNNNDQIDTPLSSSFEIKFLVHYTLKETFYSSEPSPHRKSDKKTLFIVSLCSVNWTMKNNNNNNNNNIDQNMDVDSDSDSVLPEVVDLPLKVIHSIRGTELPFYCALDPSNEGYVLGSNTSYKPTLAPIPDQSTTTRFLEPGSSAMEVDGTDLADTTTSTTATTSSSPRPTTSPTNPPYIWTQTESDVTVCFALPKGTTKHAIECKFTRQSLKLKVNNLVASSSDQQQQHQEEEFAKVLQLENMPLFDLIRPEDSYWTLESSAGVLTLSIEKQHSKTRWMQVFAEGVDMDPVDETLDPSVFAEYKASLEKYTTDQANAGPIGPSTLLPSLAQDAQEDIDEEGEEIKFSWIDSSTTVNSRKAVWDNNNIVRATTIGSGHDWIGQAFSSFDKPLSSPSSLRNNNNNDDGENPFLFKIPTVCLKHDVDGLVYSIQHVPSSSVKEEKDEEEGIMKFVHIGTFDALAFVQASKREKRWVMHDPLMRFSVIIEACRNVYIYWHTLGDKKQKQERQTVIDVSKGQHSVDIIGCQLIADGVLVVLMDGRHGALVLDLF
ncbi:hypothetical protein BG004_007727 [Podila humilis]|nr:hypothetical protein BG004_007727 [Podila humilis]